MSQESKKDKIIIIDFGSQVTKLIARRIREFNVLAEILTIKELNTVKNFDTIKGLVLSGGPSTVTVEKFPTIPRKIFSLKKSFDSCQMK